jgi:hypothetical protein
MSDVTVEVYQVGPNSVTVEELRHTVTVSQVDPNQIAVALVGTQGAAGSQIHNGNGVPDPETGAIGDYWLDSVNGALYGPKTQEGWPEEYFDIGGAVNLTELQDTNISNPATGQALIYNGTDWINKTVRFTHIQVAPSTTWTVIHNLGANPGGVSVVDVAEVSVYGDVEHLDSNTLEVSFSIPVSGKVYIS